MITIRRAQDRGAAHFNWLKSLHTFSFGQYSDPNYMGVGPLRVINEDRVIPGEGFATHSHQNMEIITYVIDGALEHKDSIGNGSIIKPGDVQRMSAGTGISHSEYNASSEHPVHFLQIWVIPDTKGLDPSYEQTHFAEAQRHNQLRLVGARDGREGAVVIHQDVSLYASILEASQSLSYALDAPGRQAWIQMVRGQVQVNGEELQAGDGVVIVDQNALSLTGIADESEFLLFDLPK